jgi:hypothetical protein
MHGARVGSDGLGTTPTHPWRSKKPSPSPSLGLGSGPVPPGHGPGAAGGRARDRCTVALRMEGIETPLPTGRRSHNI